MGNLKVKDVAAWLEKMAPTAYAEDFDNVGLLLGEPEQAVCGILVCHDALPQVIDEAVSKNCNMVVCFHPIIFSGLKKITGKTYVEQTVIKALQQGVAVYAVHTALDNHHDGVNKILCDTLGIKNLTVLIPKQDTIGKLVTFTTPENAMQVRKALFKAGAGNIGNYDHCSFNSEGIGTYRGNEHSNPKIGEKGELVEAQEIRIEVTFEKARKNEILQALFKAHFYEEVAYEISSLSNSNQHIGLGMIGDLSSMSEHDFLQHVFGTLQCGGIRHSAFTNRPIKKVAVLGGSGAFAIQHAISAGADAFITADLKYHDYFQADGKLLLADVGHYESERYIKNYIVDFLREKIPNFAIVLSETNTNPVKYF